jgi:hypothetical protein
MSALKCDGCSKRIRRHDPHIGLIDFDSGDELLSMHANEDCQRKAADLVAALVLEPGQARIIRHFHACGDEGSGFNCTGRCFAGAA